MSENTNLTQQNLLIAGAHFGHNTSKSNPKMKQYIYTKRNDIHIIDLKKTIIKTKEALEFVKKLSLENKTILFVGTKKQAKSIIKEVAEKAKCPYVNERWLGGTLTNFKTIKKNIDKLVEFENQEKSGHWQILAKKEKLMLQKQKERLERYFNGIRNMYKLPDAVFVADRNINYIVVKEANKLGIKVISLCDTNSDPDNIDYVIPANDDATKSIAFFVNLIADTYINNNPNKKVEVKAAVSKTETETIKPVSTENNQELKE